MRKIVLAAAFGLMAATPCLAWQSAPAAPAPPVDVEARWALADANKDGKVEKAELLAVAAEERKASIEQYWSYMDANGDGSLNKEEFAAIYAQR